MIIKKFKNNNISVKYERNIDYSNNLIEQLCNSAELDFIPADEPVYYWTLYNTNTLKFYNINDNDINNFKLGKTVRLIAYSDDIKEYDYLAEVL